MSFLEPQPQTPGFSLPWVGVAGTVCPPHNPSPGPQTPGGNSQGLSLTSCPKRGEIKPRGGGTGRDLSVQGVTLLCLTVRGVKVKIGIFGRCLQAPCASLRARGRFGTDFIPPNPTPSLGTMGTLPVPDSWLCFLPA